MTKNKSRLGLIAVISVVITIFLLFMGISSGLSAKSKAVIAKKDIKLGTVISENNINDLFETGEIKDETDEGYYAYSEDLKGAIMICDIKKGQTLTDTMITDNFKPISNIKEPVVMGLRAVDASQFVSGTLRRGDTINLSFVDEFTGECNTIMENVFVCGAFKDDGSPVEDEDGRAMSINIYIEKKDEKVINEFLHKGMLRISKTGRGLNE